MPFDIQTARISDDDSRRTILPGDGAGFVDPFLGLVEWGPSDASEGLWVAGESPQAEFESITYVLTGALTRRDSSAHETIVRAGGVERVTSAFLAEYALPPGAAATPQEAGLHAISIRFRVSPSAKPVALQHQAFDLEQLPVHTLRGSWVRVLAGSFDGVRAPLDTDRSTFIAHVRLDARADIAFRLEPGATTLVYALDGSAQIGPQALIAGQLATSREPRSYVAIAAQSSSFEALVLSVVAPRGPLDSAIEGGAPRVAAPALG